MLVGAPTPLPVSGMLVGLLLALLVRVTAPVRVPELVGVNFTVTEQDAPTVRVAQVLVWLKRPLAGPAEEGVTAETVAAVVPLLVTVTVWVAADWPTMVPAKVRLAGLAERIGPGATPVP